MEMSKMPAVRMRAVCAVCAILAWAAAAEAAHAAPQTPAPPVAEGPPEASRLQFYGFIREDLILDDSRPDSAQSPLFILSEPAHADASRTYTVHPRLTRLGMNLSGPALEPLGGARLSGKLEMDFQNGGRDSRAIPRYRHAYMLLDWTSTSVLIGQTFDVISPLFPSVNADTLMWNAGNLGDRRPQVRATHQRAAGRAGWSIAAAAGLTGAVDQQDLDGDGIRDGEAAPMPSVQTRIGVTWPAGARRLAAGVWAHGSRQTVAGAVAGETRFASHAVGVDLELPLGTRGVVRGELWTGRNLPDIRGGIGQGINRGTGQEIGSRGGWFEIGGELSTRYAVFAGYSLDSPNADEVPAGGRTQNGAWFLASRFTVGRPFAVGVDYLRWRTEYRGLPAGTDNRINAYAIYNF